MKPAVASGMRIFVPVFTAILAAAVVILLFLGAKSRLDNWAKAKNECLSAINSLEPLVEETYEHSLGGSIEELSAALRTMGKAQTGIKEAEKQLLIVLQHKPFFLPLTRDEQKILDGLKSDLQGKTEATSSPTNETTAEATAARTPDVIKYDTKIHPENIILDAPAPSLTNKTTSEATSTPREIPTSTPTIETVTLTKPVSVQLESGTVTLPIGTKLEFVSQVGPKVHVRYLNSDQMVPISATDLK